MQSSDRRPGRIWRPSEAAARAARPPSAAGFLLRRPPPEGAAGWPRARRRRPPRPAPRPCARPTACVLLVEVRGGEDGCARPASCPEHSRARGPGAAQLPRRPLLRVSPCCRATATKCRTSGVPFALRGCCEQRAACFALRGDLGRRPAAAARGGGGGGRQHRPVLLRRGRGGGVAAGVLPLVAGAARRGRRPAAGAVAVRAQRPAPRRRGLDLRELPHAPQDDGSAAALDTVGACSCAAGG